MGCEDSRILLCAFPTVKIATPYLFTNFLNKPISFLNILLFKRGVRLKMFSQWRFHEIRISFIKVRV